MQNICVYADASREYPIALVFPFIRAASNWAHQKSVPVGFSELKFFFTGRLLILLLLPG